MINSSKSKGREYDQPARWLMYQVSRNRWAGGCVDEVGPASASPPCRVTTAGQDWRGSLCQESCDECVALVGLWAA